MIGHEYCDAALAIKEAEEASPEAAAGPTLEDLCAATDEEIMAFGVDPATIDFSICP